MNAAHAARAEATRAQARATMPRRAAGCCGTVVRRGVRDQRNATLAYGGALGAMGALMAALWPAIEPSIGKLLDSYPPELKDAFNIVTIDSVETYIDAEMLSLIVPFAVSALAIRIVTQAIAGRRRARDPRHAAHDPAVTTARSSRARSSTAALAAGAALLITTLATFLVGVLAGADPSLLVLVGGTANVWPLALLGAGIAAAAAGRAPGVATGVAVGALVAMYVLDLVGKLAPSVAFLRDVSAFKYLGSAIQQGIDPIGFLGVAMAGVALGGARGLDGSTGGTSDPRA